MPGEESEQEELGPFEYNEKAIGFTTEEKTALNMTRKEKAKEIKTLLEIEFPKLTRMSASKFYDRVTDMLNSYADFRREQQLEIGKHISEMKVSEKRAQDVMIDLNDPYRKALIASKEILKKFVIMLDMTAFIESLMINERERYVEVIDEVKDIEI